MRILHVIKSLGRGGAEMLLPETIKLHSKQHEFYVIYFLPWKNQLVKELEEAGASVYCFNKTNNITLLLSFYKLIRFIKQNKIDCVHAHLPWAGFVSRLASRFIQIPLVYTEHNKQERYHGITKWLNKVTFGWQHTVVAVSEDVKTSIEKNIGTKYLTQIILNGVNTKTFSRDAKEGAAIRKQLDIPTNAIVISTIAVFRFQKRLSEWLHVAYSVLEKNNHVYFVIVGDGPLRNELLSRNNQLGGHPNVRFAGLQENVKPWLSATDIYMMTSVFEGLPIALLEAMSMQCAIVTTNAGGIKEVIEHNENGLMRDVSNWQQLTEDLQLLIDNQHIREQLAVGARERVKQSFSLDRMVRELEKLYSDLTNK